MESAYRSRRLLQVLTGILGGLTIGLGAMSLVFGVHHPIYGFDALPELPELDSNLRFLGGLGLGLGGLMIWIIPRIEVSTAVFRAVWYCAFLGGVGRLVSILAVGAPSVLMTLFSVLEVVGAPLMIYWQRSVANQARPS